LFWAQHTVQRIKFKQFHYYHYQYFDTILELLTGTKKNRKNWIGKQGKQFPYGQHQPKADIDHWCVPRKRGGKGLMQLEEAYLVEITRESH